MGQEGCWLIILGGSRSKQPFFQAARKLGFKTLLLDNDVHAACRESANEFRQVSIRDSEAVVAVCEGFAVSMGDDFAFAGCLAYVSHPDGLLGAAALRSRFSLPGPDRGVLQLLSNKERLSSLLKGQSIPIPAQTRVVSDEEAQSFAREHGRVIFKPVHGHGGTGVFSSRDAGRAYREAAAHGEVLAQSYCEGVEYVINGWVRNGVAHVAIVAQKLMKEGTFSVESLETATDSNLLQRAREIAGQCTGVVGLDDSFFSLDVIDGPDGLTVLDMGVLLDAKVDRLLEYMGVDVYSAACRLVAQEEGPALRRTVAGGALRFLYADAQGILRRIQAGGVIGDTVVVEWERSDGDTVSLPEGVASTVGWVMAPDLEGTRTFPDNTLFSVEAIQPCVLLVGGGIQQVPALERARAMGFKVFVTDQNPGAPCVPLADGFGHISGRDTEGLATFAKQLCREHNLVCVFTLTELVEGACAAAKAAGLPSATMEAAALSCDKEQVKAIWLDQSVPTPKGGTVRTLQEAGTVLSQLGRRIFAKPATGFGGQGGAELTGSDAVLEFLGETWQEEPGTPYILEDFASGAMYDVNGCFDGDGLYVELGIVERRFLDAAPVETAILAPPDLTVDEQKALHALLEQGVRALGITDGPVKGDAVLTEAGFLLLEVAPRLHGPKSTVYTLPFAGEAPLERMLYMMAQRAGIDDRVESAPVSDTRCCLCRTFLPEPGTIERISGVAEARKIPGVQSVVLLRKEGETVGPYRDNTGIVGFTSVAGADMAECQTIFHEVERTLTIETSG